MKNLLSYIILAFTTFILSAQNSETEILQSCGHNAAIIDLIPWQNGLLEIAVCNGSEIQNQSISKKNLVGETEWEVNFFSYGSRFKMAPDSSFWLFESGGCDFLDSPYQLRHIDKYGVELEAFSGDLQDDPIAEEYIFSNFCTWVNDTILALPAYSSINFFNLNQQQFLTQLMVDPGSLNENSLYSLGNSKYVAMSDSFLLFGEFGEAPIFYEAGNAFHEIWVFEDNVYVHRDSIIDVLNANAELLFSYQLSESISVLDLDVQEQIHALLSENETVSVLSLSLEFDEMGIATLEQTDVFSPNCLLRMNDKFILGGWNGHHLTSQSVFKTYDLAGSSMFFNYDLELIEVYATSYTVQFLAVGPDYYIYSISAEDVFMDVKNNSAEAVQGFTAYANLFLPGYCNGVFKVAQSNQNIPSGETVTFNFENTFLSYIQVPFGQELQEIEFNFNKCLWIHAPSGRMDKVPDNDYSCATFSGSFTTLEESVMPSLKFIHQNDFDQIQLDATAAIEWHVFDISGKQIMKGSSISGKNHINLNRLTKGFYIFQYTANGAVGVEKFIKR